jgi:ubiquinone/menaquinone biosynthesis C-methylase UbiE
VDRKLKLPNFLPHISVMASIAAFTGSIPGNYDKYLGPVLFEPYALDLTERLKKESLKNVLELACGTGRVTRHLVSLLPADGKLIASDLNPDMMSVAKTRVTDERVKWLAADAQDLPFAQDSFDHIVCQFGVMFFPDKGKAFAEAYRVLQPGGLYLFNTWAGMEQNPRTAIIRKIMEDQFQENSPDFLKKGPYSFFDPVEIRGWMEGAGFTDVKIEAVDKVARYTSVDDFLKGFLEGSPLSAFLAEKDKKIQEEVRKKISDEMKKQFSEHGMDVPMQALVCQGRK